MKQTIDAMEKGAIMVLVVLHSLNFGNFDSKGTTGSLENSFW